MNTKQEKPKQTEAVQLSIDFSKIIEKKISDDNRLAEFQEKISDDLYYLKRTVARNCMRLRKQMGWTQRHLAESLGLSQSHIQYLESGLGNPTIELILKVAKSFEVEMTEFFVKSVWELTHHQKNEFSQVKATNHEMKKMAVQLPEGWEFQRVSLCAGTEIHFPSRKKTFRQIFFCTQGSLLVSSREAEQEIYMKEEESVTVDGALAIVIKNGPSAAELIHLCYREK